MRPPRDSRKYLDSIVIVFGLAAFLLLPPFVTFWATPPAPWYLPYLVWLGIVVLVALVHATRNDNEL